MWLKYIWQLMILNNKYLIKKLVYCWGQNRSRRNQCRKLLWKCPLWKTEIKFKRKEKREKPKSSFLSTPKRIHTISLRERLLQASEKRITNNEKPIVQLAEGASWTERTVQLAKRAIWIEQVVQHACLASWIN